MKGETVMTEAPKMITPPGDAKFSFAAAAELDCVFMPHAKSGLRFRASRQGRSAGQQNAQRLEWI
jgi:hypothetical protein